MGPQVTAPITLLANIEKAGRDRRKLAVTARLCCGRRCWRDFAVVSRLRVPTTKLLKRK